MKKPVTRNLDGFKSCRTTHPTSQNKISTEVRKNSISPNITTENKNKETYFSTSKENFNFKKSYEFLRSTKCSMHPQNNNEGFTNRQKKKKLDIKDLRMMVKINYENVKINNNPRQQRRGSLLMKRSQPFSPLDSPNALQDSIFNDNFKNKFDIPFLASSREFNNSFMTQKERSMRDHKIFSKFSFDTNFLKIAGESKKFHFQARKPIIRNWRENLYLNASYSNINN